MIRNVVCFVGLLFLFSCASKELAFLPADPCEAVTHFIKVDGDNYRKPLDEAAMAFQNEEWKSETGDPSASPEKFAETFKAVQDKAYRREYLERAREVSKLAQSLDPAKCPAKVQFERAKFLLETSMLVDPQTIALEKRNAQLQDAFSVKTNGYRMELPDEKEPVSRAIYSKKLSSISDRAARKKLYETFNSGRADKWEEWKFKDLVKARNEEAKQAGFKNYFEYRFFRNQLDLPQYLEMAAKVKKVLVPKLQKAIVKMGKKEGIKKVEAWDIRYLRSRSDAGEIDDLLVNMEPDQVLEVAKFFYKNLGIDVDSYHFTMDLYPRNGKNTHAFAMTVKYHDVDEKGNVLPNSKNDTRFVANLRKPVKWDDISTVIHELGHAIHGAEVRQPRMIFRDLGTIPTEAIAMTLERMADSSEFIALVLNQYAKAPSDKISAALKDHVQGVRTEQAFNLIRQIMFVDFEKRFYENPDLDYKAEWSKLQKEYLGVDVPAKYSDWDIDHYVMSPVYIEHYVIGFLMVEQLYHHILTTYRTSYQSVELGNKLKKVYFAPGEEFSYLDYTERFTGRPLTATAALKLLD